MQKINQKKICVCGSANGDCFMYVHHIPVPGETIQATKYMQANGGKGANQAVAVGKLAGSCEFIGQVGNDSHMKNLQRQMSQANVKLSWTVKDNCTTGKAFIYVDEKGQNSIVIVGEANTNYQTKTELAANFRAAIDANNYLLLQKEIPSEINVLAAQYAKSQGKIVVLDCGGSDYPITESLLQNLDYISPNQTELSRLEANIDLNNIVQSVRAKLISKYPNLKVLLKEGSNGSSLITKQLLVKCPASTNQKVLADFKIIDTVGAGDCFTGAFAVRHSQLEWSDPSKMEANYYQALKFGNSSAFLCITKQGAMPSQPWRKDVDQFMNKYL